MAVVGHYEHLELQMNEEDADSKTCLDLNLETETAAQEKDPQKILQSDLRLYGRVGVGVGLLCAVLALLNVAIPLYLYQSYMVARDQLVISYHQLQASNNNLTEGRDQLQTRFNQLQNRHDRLTEQKDQIQTGFDQLQTSFDQLQNRHNNLTKQKDQLQTSFDQLQTGHNYLTGQKDQLQASFDQLQNMYNNVTEERDNMKMRLCESLGWQAFDRGCYYISTEEKNWEDSRQWCRDRQSDLIVINSQEKQDFVERLNKRVWLGLTDREDERTYKWVDGTPLTAPTYWLPGQPNNKEPITHEQQDCVEYHIFNGTSVPKRGWNDRICNAFNPWICERVLC